MNFNSNSAANFPYFIPSPCFQGRRIYYVFKKDTLGLGYYLDKYQIRCSNNQMIADNRYINVPFNYTSYFNMR